MQKIKYLLLTLFSLFGVTACATITGMGKDNTPPPSPLVKYTSQVSPKNIWSTDADNGSGKYYLNFVPAISTDNSVVVADQAGDVVAVNASNGKKQWQTQLKQRLVVGPGVGDGMIVVGAQNAQVTALNQNTGKVLWRTNLSDPITAIPVIDGNQVILKTLDGGLWSLNASTGSVLWQNSHSIPTMILAGGSTPVIVGNKVIVGYPDGKLIAYSLSQGQMLWQTQIALPNGASDVEQLTDIVANPEVAGDTVYVVTYQGNLDAVNINNGQILWQQPLSSYSGLAITPTSIDVTDAGGNVWSFDRSNGQMIWKQSYLANRKLTAPVLAENTLAIADDEGYVHLLNQANGVTVGRISASSKPIITAPVVYGNQMYVLSTNGRLSRYQL